jgi:hypothetical protein
MAELIRAQTEIQNVKAAILQGILTPTTRELLETCERRVAELEAALRTPAKPVKAVSLAGAIATYLSDLQRTMTTDIAYARTLLEKLVRKISLRRDGSDLVAGVRGNLVGILGAETVCGFHGAGRGIPSLPNIGGTLSIA